MRALGDLESVVMQLAWQAERALTVRELRERMARRPPLAYTTVLTVMDNLHRKGFLERERDGRAYRYRPTRTRAEFTAELMAELLSESGDRSGTLLRFVDHMSPSEVSHLRQALDD